MPLDIVSTLGGGVLIGLSAAALLLGAGRIAGISGILGDALVVRGEGDDRAWRLLFLAGLIGGGAVIGALWPGAFERDSAASAPLLVLAGLLVGFGTRLSSGCTSGHGVCGISRGSVRSIVATLTFMLTGAITVALVGAHA